MTLRTCVLGGLLLSVMLNGAARGDERPAVFVGSSPCGDPIRKLLRIPADASADLMEWTVTLHRHPRTHEPERYTLRCEYGPAVPNTTGVTNPSATVEREGRWTIGR